MERTALRLATMACLLNGGNGPPWPTLVGEYVYDSRIGNIRDIVLKDIRPIIIVRTDEDIEMHDRQSAYSGRQCSLLLELSIISSVTDTSGKLLVDWPQSDPALEAMLDALEWQVVVALRGYGAWAQWYQGAPPKGMRYGSEGRHTSRPRYAVPERGSLRLAVRTLDFTIKLPPDCIPKPLHEADPNEPAMLPPSLCQVINYITVNGGGNFRTAILEISESIQSYGKVVRTRYPALTRVWASVPKWEIEADWKLPQLDPMLEGSSITAREPSITSPYLNP